MPIISRLPAVRWREKAGHFIAERSNSSQSLRRVRCGERLPHGLSRDVAVGSIEEGTALIEDDHLRRFVANAELFGDFVGSRTSLLYDDFVHRHVFFLHEMHHLTSSSGAQRARIAVFV